MAQEPHAAGLPGRRGPNRRHRGALLLAGVVLGNPSRGNARRRLDTDFVSRPVRQQRHGRRLPDWGRHGSRTGRAGHRLRIFVGNTEDSLHPASRPPHHPGGTRGCLSSLVGDLDPHHLCSRGRIQRRRRVVPGPRGHVAGSGRHRQGHCRDLARPGRERFARHGAWSPVQAVGGRARRGPDLRDVAPDRPHQIHHDPQWRCVQVDRRLVRWPERDSTAEHIHIASIRTLDSAGYRRRASRARAGGIPRLLHHCRRGAAAAEGRHIANFPPSTGLRGRPWSWINGRPRLVDGLLVAITLVPALIGTIVSEYFRVSTPLFIAALVLAFFKSVPLWWRRRQPVAVLVIVAGALLAGEVLGLQQTASDGAITLAAYAVWVYGSSTARLWVVAIAALGTVVVFITALTGISPRRESLLTLGPPVLVAWVIGDYIRGRRAFFTELITRHRRESEALRRQAVEDERLRIARELHDVVAHNVSLMAIQPGAARVAGTADGETQHAL